MKKVSGKKMSVELNNMANNLNNNVRRVVKNDMAINLIRVLVILYTAFALPGMDRRTLDFLNNNVVRLVLCALIVYLAFMDVVTSVLLTIAFVLTIHHGKKRTESSNVVQDVDENLINKINDLNDVRVENYEDLNNALNNNRPAASPRAANNTNLEEENPFVENQVANNNLVNGPASNNNVNGAAVNEELNIANNQVENVANNEVEPTNIVNEPPMNNNVAPVDSNIPLGLDTTGENDFAVFNASANNRSNNVNDNASMEERNNMHPASSTLTDNILNVAVGVEPDANGPTGLTTWQNLYDASENAVPGADIMNQVRSVEGGLSAQGMNGPLGYNHPRHNGYHYENGANLVHQGVRNNVARN